MLLLVTCMTADSASLFVQCRINHANEWCMCTGLLCKAASQQCDITRTNAFHQCMYTICTCVI